MIKQTEFEKIEKNARACAVLSKAAVYTLLVFWAIMVLFPFYWMLLTSVKEYGAYNAEFIPKFFTLSPTFENRDLHRGNDLCHAACDHSGCICVCKTQFQG